jgi:endonuclease-3
MWAMVYWHGRFVIMNIEEIITVLQKHTKAFAPTLTDQIIVEFGKDPFLILISCLLSLRAKDTTTIHVCRALFAQVRTPKELVELPRPVLEKIIYKTGFYKKKAKVLQQVSQSLIDNFKGKVPRDAKTLLSITGIGPKTAALVMSVAYGKPAICVDTHVHRISNRLGLVKTRTVEQTDEALQKVLPRKYWGVWNGLLVLWGQNVCAPLSPKCSLCSIRQWCGRVGVKKCR